MCVRPAMYKMNASLINVQDLYDLLKLAREGDEGYTSRGERDETVIRKVEALLQSKSESD